MTMIIVAPNRSAGPALRRSALAAFQAATTKIAAKANAPNKPACTAAVRKPLW
ncbi:hypothetical protein [Mesorhizobium sp.]|uniref:hypothetical protein n=1 Tax=Mesorhizobium sp. TaxID=1871066 RepID=UPI00345657BE